MDAVRHHALCVCDLMDVLDAAQSRPSFHLKVLRDSGLVHARRDGRWIYYALGPAAFGAADEDFFNHHSRSA